MDKQGAVDDAKGAAMIDVEVQLTEMLRQRASAVRIDDRLDAIRTGTAVVPLAQRAREPRRRLLVGIAATLIAVGGMVAALLLADGVSRSPTAPTSAAVAQLDLYESWRIDGVFTDGSEWMVRRDPDNGVCMSVLDAATPPLCLGNGTAVLSAAGQSPQWFLARQLDNPLVLVLSDGSEQTLVGEFGPGAFTYFAGELPAGAVLRARDASTGRPVVFGSGATEDDGDTR